MKFTKVVIENTKGLQPSATDFLLSEFVHGGDALQFDEKSPENPDGMTRQKASNIAKRFMRLAPGKHFHSFFDVTTKKVTVRLRKEGEVPADGDSDTNTGTEQEEE